MAKRIQKKRRPSRLRRAGRTLYRTAVALSALIVAGFVAWQVLVRPPAQSAAPPSTAPLPTAVQPAGESAAPQEPAEETAPPPERRAYTYTFLLAASDQSSGNADTIMVATYDVPNAKVGVVSIPRDTLVDRKTPKINAAYLGKDGASTLKSVVADLVGFPIDYYITVDITAFKALVNAVDGVDFYIPCDMDYDDPTQDLSIHYQEGMRHLDGAQALEVVRFRHNNDGSGYTDVGRSQTQQKMLAAIAKKVFSLSSVTKFNRFVDIFTSYVKTDLSASDIAYFASNALSVDLAAGLSTGTLPGDGTVTYRGTRWCYRLYPQECLDLLNQTVNPYTTDLTLDRVHFFQG